jgi:hypothetical protein
MPVVISAHYPFRVDDSCAINSESLVKKRPGNPKEGFGKGFASMAKIFQILHSEEMFIEQIPKLVPPAR